MKFILLLTVYSFQDIKFKYDARQSSLKHLWRQTLFTALLIETHQLHQTRLRHNLAPD